MSVPPVSDEELPDLVRFQALREFTHVNEDWLIDYLLLDEDPSQPRNALVAALAPELFQDIQKTCQIAKVQPERIVLRPCATASLANRCVPPKPDEIRLLVDLLGEEVDLSVLWEQIGLYADCAGNGRSAKGGRRAGGPCGRDSADYDGRPKSIGRRSGQPFGLVRPNTGVSSFGPNTTRAS